MACSHLPGRFSDALKRLRAALVHSRVGATWVVAQGVGGLQRAMLLAAKVRGYGTRPGALHRAD